MSAMTISGTLTEKAENKWQAFVKAGDASGITIPGGLSSGTPLSVSSPSAILFPKPAYGIPTCWRIWFTAATWNDVTLPMNTAKR